MKLDGGVHLTYCSNIHPGESWPAVREALARHLPEVRRRVAPGRRFGIGLRLSAQAAETLAEPAELAAFRDWLAANELYVFTLNGFPHGRFHGAGVKSSVYLPDWRDAERLRYSNRLAELLAALLPADEPQLAGSVSTVPGAFKPALQGPGDAATIAGALIEHVAHLVALKSRSGRHIALALEPEPHCFLETIDEAVAFFAGHLHSPAAARALASRSGLAEAQAARALREHLGLCLDLCHAAVEFEDAGLVFARLREAGIAVPKVQVSAGLALTSLDDASLAALRAFDDPHYLHQVVQRHGGSLTRFADLPDAFASLAGDGPAELAAREWRVHFHVPVFVDAIAPFASTQAFVREALALQRAQPISAHLEVETYTWGVLPPSLRGADLDEDIARELRWVQATLAA